MAGAAGHTYGCHPVWQMMDRGRTPVTFARRPWREALDLPGAFQMTHVRSFFDSRSARGRVPDQGMLPGSPSAGPHGELASHAGSSAFVYLPEGFPVEVRMDRVGGRTVKASWFDPRTGGRALIGSSESSGLRRFTPPGAPGAGNDWVLVLEGEPG
jgi:hypothetical protein